MWRKNLSLCFLALAAACSCLAQPYPGKDGPLGLIVQYRCAPGQRAEFRDRVVHEALPQFERWRTAGILSGYRLLYSRYVNTDTWDMMAILTFPTYDDVERWRRSERYAPGGLPPSALALTLYVNSYPVDVTESRTGEEPSIRPVFLVLPYANRMQASSLPGLEAELRHGDLVRLDVFRQHYDAGRPWSSVMVLEYKNDNSFGRATFLPYNINAREPVIADEIALR